MNRPDYEAIDAVNWSTLKHIKVSPKHYRHALTAEREESDALAIGRAVHLLTFDPGAFDDAFAVWGGDRRAGKEWVAFKTENAGRSILRATDYADVVAMVAALTSSPLLAPFLDGGAIVEQPIVWTDAATGLRCKGIPDVWHPKRRALIDVKTSVTIDPFRFGRIAAAMGYCEQLAHYDAGLTALGHTVEQRVIVLVEKSAPFDVGALEVVGEEWDYAVGERDRLLARLAECRERDEWPGQYPAREALRLPAYLFMDENDNDPSGFGLTVGGE